MPYPGVPKNLTAKMDRCVEDVMSKQGLSKPRAIAICKTSIVGKKALTFSDMEHLVRLSWDAMFDPEDFDHPYLRYIFPDYAVFAHLGRLYRVDYEMDNTSVDFDTDSAQEVEMEFEPVKFGAVLVPRPIRAVDGGDGRYKAYAVLFGGPDDRDMYGTYFDRDTRYYLDWWDKRPWLFHHGISDGAVHREHLVRSGSQRVGVWDEHGVDDIGVFVQGELDARHKYLDAVKLLLDDEQILFPSSGTIDYIMRVADDGHVIDWPIAEVSSTVAPAELRAQPLSSAGRAALRALCDIPEGRYTMALPEKLQGLLGRRDAEETEEVVEAEEVVETEEEETTEEEASEFDVAEFAAEVARHLDLETVVGAIQQLDDVARGLSERVDVIEEAVRTLAADEPDRVKAFVNDPDWSKRLWSATRSEGAEEVDEDEAKDIVDQNNPRTTDGGVYDAVKVQ